MKKILVLGCGMVGSSIAADLSSSFDVTAADSDKGRLASVSHRYNIKTKLSDLANSRKLSSLVRDYDLVVNSLPGFMGFYTLKTIISAGKDTVDISFFAEDAFILDELAREKNVTAAVDCGIAPGLSNIILGYHYGKEKVKSFTCYVGGLPFERIYPFQYKAPFSPSDVIEEYTRPARTKKEGHIRVVPPLSEPEQVNIKGVGTLEAFNSDGLRTLLKTMDIPDMKEKTLRYPGHRYAVELLKDCGFFSEKETDINGHMIKPVDFSSKLLFDTWKLNPEDDEFTVLKMSIESESGKYGYYLFDRKDFNSGFSSMARTTGFTCTAVVNLMMLGKIRQKGICPPEYIGMSESNYRYVLKYLHKRGVAVEEEHG